MSTISMKTFYTLLSGFGLCMLCSCYAYGPIHESYTQEKITPPPPVQKKVGAPLSKREYMLKTYNDLKNTLVDADVRMIEDSIKVLFPNNIIFEKLSIAPSSNYQEPLTKFAELLNKYFKTNILITGHTDSKGDPYKNKELSRLRAENIKTFIVQQGVVSTRLESFGVGDLSPIASNETDEGRSKNRRVEFVVLYKN